MNSKFITAAVITLAALSSASTFAASSSQYSEPAEFSRSTVSTSSLTRAQVRAEYLAARQSGKLVVGQEADINPAKDSVSSLSRAQVMSDVMATGTTEQNKLYSNAM